MRFIFCFLWSLWGCGNHYDHTHVKQHVVVQAALPRDAVLPPILTHERKLVRFADSAIGLPARGDPGAATIVPLASVFRARDTTTAFPQFHPYTRSHYFFFSQGVYASVMAYADYCAMEDKLAHIVGNYLQDQKNNWLLVIDDPSLARAVRGYGGPSFMVDRTTWVSTTSAPYSYSDFVLLDIESDKGTARL